MKKNGLSVIIVIYSIFALATLFSWQAVGINSVTGDEPNYLVMSSGIVRHGSLEQTAPYMEEFQSREIFKAGLAPKDAQPSPGNTHAVLGIHGLFNVHNVGLPLLLALPFMIGGVVGAKLFMVFVGALVVVCAWKLSSLFSQNNKHRVPAVIATVISLPLIPASNQIYPDLLAGLISLVGLYWFLTVDRAKTSGLEFLMAAAIAFLPWLQIKFVATSIVLLVSVTAKIYFESKDLKRILGILAISVVSLVTLAFYNYYAFGKITGPYQSGALETSKTSVMVFWGLLIDQNQGFLLQNPVNMFGVLALGWIYKLNRQFFLVWILVFLSLIVPNALHPNWYGGWVFSGRFQWSAEVVFIMPTILGLITIGRIKERLFAAIIAAGSALQLYFFYLYANSGVSLYNRGVGTPVDAYSIFYGRLHAWLPMLYDSSWAYEYWPNYFWVLLVVLVLLVGFFCKQMDPGKLEGDLNSA